MFYRMSDMMKSSFFAMSLACLLSSTALAQTSLDLTEDGKNNNSEANLNVSESENNPLTLPANSPLGGGENSLLTPSAKNPLGGNEKTASEQPVVSPSEGDESTPSTLPADNPQGDKENDSTEQSVDKPLDETANNSEGDLNTDSEKEGVSPNDNKEGETPDSAKKNDSEKQENTKETTEQSNTQENDAVLKAYSNFMDETDKKSFNNDNPNSAFGDKIMDQVKEDLFSQMADIEKQTSLLTLELKREKIKNEIAAMHAQRKKAFEEEREKQREKERKQAEWQKEQERRLVEEQEKLKQMEIKYEKLRQEKVLRAYKESMLKSNQEWVEYNSRLYNQLIKEEKAQNDLMTKQKEYFKKLAEAITKVKTEAEQAKEKHTQEVANLQTQVAILKSKLEAEKAAYEESQKTGPNPFALADEDNSAPKAKIAEEYAIMEISGKGDMLVAKLINKNGGTFMVKPGTILNTGHIIEEITQTYIVTDKGGLKDFLYFSAGGILDKEPSDQIKASMPSDEGASHSSGGTLNLRSGMFVE